MKISKKRGAFSIGRKLFLTLALFLLVFAAASIVKIQAAGNVTGWLWGGSEDANLGGTENCMVYPANPSCIDGDETGFGWISMNCLDRESATGKTCKDKNDPSFDFSSNIVDYGVNFPESGNASGYGWGGENIGWVDFSGVSVTAIGSEKHLSGTAQIVSILQAGLNAGGWSGKIKMAGDGSSWNGSSCTGINDYGNNNRRNYGVIIDSDGNFSGKGWNGEEDGSGGNMANGFGWIDFSRAEITEILGIRLTDINLNSSNNPGDLYAQLIDSGGNDKAISGKRIIFSEISDPSGKIAIVDSPPECTTGVGGGCLIRVQATNFQTNTNGIIKGECSDSSCGSDDSNVTVEKDLACTCSAPSSFTITAGDTDKFHVTIDGDAGCALNMCSAIGGSISVSTDQPNSDCVIEAPSSSRYGCTEVETDTTGGEDCLPPTNVCIKGPGWIET